MGSADISTSGVMDGFVSLDREWRTGDVIDLLLPLDARTMRGFRQSVSVHRGPLVFSLAVGGAWLKLVERGKASDWQVYPTKAWDYALALSGDSKDGMKVEELPVGEVPFSQEGAPIRITVRAHRVPSWRAEDGVAAEVPGSPVATFEPAELIALHPYAAGKLRITAFPVVAG